MPFPRFAAPLTEDPRGPIGLPGLEPVVSPEGVQARADGFARRRHAAPAWSAAWVRVDTEPETIVTCIRKEVMLAKMPSHAGTWVSADQHYRLYVNGRLVARGPADPGEDYPGGKSETHSGLYYADYLDLAPYLRAGSNVIAVEVFIRRITNWYGSSCYPGFLFQAQITAGGETVEVRSDESWRGIAASYFQWQDDMLAYLPAGEPAGWRLPGFDDSGWAPCVPAGEHWPKLLPSALVSPPLEAVYPPQGVVRVSPSMTISAPPFSKPTTITADGGFALQYDRVLSGYLRVKVNGGAGATLTFGMNERNAPGGRRLARMVLAEGTQYFETPFYGSFTYLNVEATGVKTPIVLEDVSAVFSSYPVTYAGAFACSDEALTRNWHVCRWLLQLCMQDHFLDSPDHQEPICDPGDYLIESLLSYYAFGEVRLTEQDLRKFDVMLERHDYINFHTSYALLWVQMLLDYYDYTGDLALVRELAPQVHGLLQRFAGWRGKNGLISEAPDYMFMDWVEIAGFSCHHPPAVIGQGYLTAFYYQGLADARRIAELAGDTDRLAGYDRLRTEVGEAFNRELWHAEKGLYRDGKPFQTAVPPNDWLPADVEIETFSPHVNTLAVLYDLAPQGEQAAILRRVMAEQPLNCQPYFMHFVFNALAHAGLFDEYAVALMRRWQVDEETQSFPEMWGGGDMSHSWQCTPLYQLSARVLGVTPLTPGFTRIAIRPTLCGLAWAKGSVPTPHGPVAVSWKCEEGTFRLNVNVPTGCEAEVTIPAGFTHPIVMVNGQEINV